MKNKAVFLDRDGTINYDKGYVHKIEDFKFIPGAIEAIQLLNRNNYKVIVVTNQAGIARGYYTENDVDILHKSISAKLAMYEARIDAFYYCPHHPTAGIGKYKIDCECRKPKSGLIIQASKDLDIALSDSWIIGDKESDITAGESVGCRGILINVADGALRKRNIAKNLYDAVMRIVIDGK